MQPLVGRELPGATGPHPPCSVRRHAAGFFGSPPLVLPRQARGWCCGLRLMHSFDLQDDKEDLQVANEPSGEEQEAQVDQLKEDLDQAKAEASLCEEREQLQQLEVGAA